MAVLMPTETTPVCAASRYWDNRWPCTKSEITSSVLASSRGTSAALTGTKRAWRNDGEAADALPDGVLHGAHVPERAQHLDLVIGAFGPDVPDPEAVAKARLRQDYRIDEYLSHVYHRPSCNVCAGPPRARHETSRDPPYRASGGAARAPCTRISPRRGGEFTSLRLPISELSAAVLAAAAPPCSAGPA